MKPGDIVEIEFRDHAQGDETIVFCVYGRVIKRTRVDVTIGVWVYADAKYKPAANDPNVDTYTIARDAIISHRIFHA
jgi:hypothetical protein